MLCLLCLQLIMKPRASQKHAQVSCLMVVVANVSGLHAGGTRWCEWWSCGSAAPDRH